MTLNQYEQRFMVELEEEWNDCARQLFLNWRSFVYARYTDYLRGEQSNMNEFYIRHMVMAHNDGRWDDRRNYASMAGIDL